MKNTRILSAICAAILAVCGLSSCSKQQSNVVRIGHFPNISHAQALVAHNLSRQGKGWFEQRVGKDVEIQWALFNAGPSAMESLLSGAVDVTYVGPSPAINAFARTGGEDVRIIAATSRNLEDMIAKGTFREDLYYRLNVFPIYMPALRNRKSDIVLLAEYFLKKYNVIHGKSVARITTPAINMMSTYYWPGNVRELENCIEYAVLNTSDNVISGYNLPPSLQTAEATYSSLVPNTPEEGGDYESLVS